jgi:carbonic anhydrase
MCKEHGCNHDAPTLSRRHLMAGAGALWAASTAPSLLRAAESDTPAPNAVLPQEAFERLKQGNARYVAGELEESDFSVGRVARAETQYPIAGILSCADSRVPPEVIFDQPPGNLFVSRNAGNVVSNYGLVNFEFAVANLGIPFILVLGHSGCGVVAAALGASRSRKELPGHLPELVKTIEPAVITAHGRHPGDFLAASIEENVRLGMKRLKTQSKIIGDAVAAGKAAIKGGVYDIATGQVEMV